MKLQIKNKIDDMRIRGKSSSQIALSLGLSVNTVKSYIYRHPEIPGVKPCDCCGIPVRQPEGRKPKRFCSDKCRITYWNHRYRQGGNTNEEKQVKAGEL